MSLAIRIQDYFLDLPAGEGIEVDYAVNELGDLATRQGITSNTFTVPLTRINKLAIGLNNVGNNVGTSVNRRIDGVLMQENTVVAKGFCQLTNVDNVNHEATLVFYSGNVDWLEAIRGRDICELTNYFEDYNHLWTEERVQSSFTNTQGYVYIATDNGRLTTATPATGIVLENMSPAVYVHSILEGIFQEAGFVLKGNLLADPFFRKLIIPFSGEVVSNGDGFVRDFTQNLSSNVGDSFSDTYPGGLEEYYISDPVYTVPADVGAINIGINAAILISDFIISLTATTTPATTAQLDATVAITKNQTTVLAEFALGGVSSEFGSPTETDSFGNERFEFTIEDLQLVAGDTIEFAILVTDGAVSGATGSVDLNIGSRSIDVIPEVEVPTDGIVYVAEILPCISQEDFVKWIAVSFAPFFQVDNYSREVTVFTFKEVTRNQALDWTAKVDSQIENLNFTNLIGKYSKKNFLLYESDSENTPNIEYEQRTGRPYGSGSFILDSDFVAGESDIYTAPFAGTFTEAAFNSGGDFLFLPKIVRYSDSSLTYYEADVAPASRVLVYAGLIPITTLSGGTIESMTIAGTSLENVPFAYFYKRKIGYDIDIQNQSIAYAIQQVSNPNDYGMLETYWLDYLTILDYNHYIELSLRLSALDIANLDFSKPIYIQRSGLTGYYFIDKIVGFNGSTNSTQVNLVKIGGELSNVILPSTVAPPEPLPPPTPIPPPEPPPIT